MNTLRSVCLASTVLTSALLPTAAAAREPLARPPLAGFSVLGAVIVTAAADTADEALVRRAVEKRLARAGIIIDDASGAELLVDVSAERSRAESGPCACGTFRVSLALREPVALERAPGQSFAAITWQTSGGIRRFTTTAPSHAILDVLQEQISSFLRAVESDTQKARQ